MEELINQIIEIEEKAQEVIRSAREADGALESRIETETQKMHRDIEKKMQEKNDSLRHIEEKDAEKKIAAINAETEKRLASLDEKLRQNRETWIDMIVSDVTA